MAKATDFPRQTEVIVMPDGTSRERNCFWVKSTQEKPTEGVAFPDMCIETDTLKLFYFDDDTRKWERSGS